MRVETLLRQAQRPLLIAHIAPDGDAIGSLLGLGWVLRDAGKRPTLACADPVPEDLQFLPGAPAIVSQAHGDEDLVVALDCADRQRLGSLYDEGLFARVRVANIDHHVTNTRFGTAQLIDANVASTAQIVFGLLQRLEWPVSPWAATCLLTALITDTRSFRTPNTDAGALRTAVALVEAGAPLAEINEQLNHGLSLGMIRLWGAVLSRVQYREGIIWAEISQEALRECGLAGTDSAGLVSFIASAREAGVAVLFSEREDGQVEVGIRSVPGCDVSPVALALGGGGHPQAAGCTLPGPLAVARDMVLRELAPVATPIPRPLGKRLEDSDVARSLPVFPE